MSSNAPIEIDLAKHDLRHANATLQSHNGGDANARYAVYNALGTHALAVGLDAPIHVEIDDHVGYFCAGMNKTAEIVVKGNAGQGVAENMMSGKVHIMGDASQAAGATAHGGLLVVDGNAGARCGISLKGANIVVKGSVGHMSCFMAQAGCLVVCGDAGDALGDSLYETHIYVRGTVKSLGADCVEKEMRKEHLDELQALLDQAGVSEFTAKDFKRYGSGRKLYNFNTDNLDAY